jgi:hypothetical protein
MKFAFNTAIGERATVQKVYRSVHCGDLFSITTVSRHCNYNKLKVVAEREGFEPSVQVLARTTV